VPRVYNAYKIGEVGHILMEYIPGATLGKCWARLSEVEKESVKTQLRRHVACWRRIRGEFFGAIGGGPCEDSIFKHAYGPLQIQYGPFQSRQDFNEGVVHALRNSRPNPSQYNLSLEPEILESRGIKMVFTHGDLGRGNIIFNEGRVTIIDWGAAGYSVEEREFVEAKWQASQSQAWNECISSFIPDYTQQYKFWDHLVNEMRLFSGI
jgi:Phosphotransferase enzyme family